MDWNTYRVNRWAVTAAGLALSVGAASAQAEVVFSFADGGVLDGVGLDGTMEVNGLTLSTVDIIDISGDRASVSGRNDKTNMQTNFSMGINSASTSNSTLNSESRDFNKNEGWEFSFDKDVNLIEIDFSSFNSNGSRASVKAGIFPTFNIINEDTDSDAYSLGGRFVAAGDTITLINVSPDDDPWRLDGFTVEVVPEPSSLALLGLGGLLVATRRRNA